MPRALVHTKPPPEQDLVPGEVSPERQAWSLAAQEGSARRGNNGPGASAGSLLGEGRGGRSPRTRGVSVYALVRPANRAGSSPCTELPAYPTGAQGLGWMRTGRRPAQRLGLHVGKLSPEGACLGPGHTETWLSRNSFPGFLSKSPVTPISSSPCKYTLGTSVFPLAFRFYYFFF